MHLIKKLVGDKVYLAPIDTSEEAAKKYAEWMNDPRITDYLGRTGQIFTLAFEQKYLENVAQDRQSRDFAIVAKEGDKLIGMISLAQLDLASRSAVMGLYIGDTEFHSHGYGTEAVNLILEFGFKYLNLHSVRLGVLSGNKRARRCYEKCGFRENGRSRDQFFINGQYQDDIHMDILESEFQGDFIRNKEM